MCTPIASAAHRHTPCAGWRGRPVNRGEGRRRYRPGRSVRVRAVGARRERRAGGATRTTQRGTYPLGEPGRRELDEVKMMRRERGEQGANDTAACADCARVGPCSWWACVGERCVCVFIARSLVLFCP